eukprot:scaffold2648_cov60-Cyclotella_meneghiniana.AAC.1
MDQAKRSVICGLWMDCMIGHDAGLGSLDVAGPPDGCMEQALYSDRIISFVPGEYRTAYLGGSVLSISIVF